MNSVLQFLDDAKYFLIPFGILGGIFLGGFLILSHDLDISQEHLYYSIYKGDSCESLLWDKSFEVRKIFKDYTELEVIDHYLMEGNC